MAGAVRPAARQYRRAPVLRAQRPAQCRPPFWPPST